MYKMMWLGQKLLTPKNGVGIVKKLFDNSAQIEIQKPEVKTIKIAYKTIDKFYSTQHDTQKGVKFKRYASY